MDAKECKHTFKDVGQTFKCGVRTSIHWCCHCGTLWYRCCAGSYAEWHHYPGEEKMVRVNEFKPEKSRYDPSTRSC